MDTAYISAIPALAGSVIGGLTTGFTTILTQRSQARAGQIAHELSRREDLVRDFIIAASKILRRRDREQRSQDAGDRRSLFQGQPHARSQYAESVVCADAVMRSILAPNRTIADIREIVKKGGGVDPLKDFAEAAREELHAFALL